MTIEAQRAVRPYSSNLPTSDYSRPDLGSVSPPSPEVGESGEGEEQSNRQQPAAENTPENPQENRRPRAENSGAENPSPAQQSSEQSRENRQLRPDSEPRNAVINPETDSGTENSGRTAPEQLPNVPATPEVPEPTSEPARPQNTSPPETEAESAPETQKQGEAEGPRGLSTEERRKVRELRKIDRKVRNHEQAHTAAGGQYVKSQAKFEYTYGPDGNRYAVGGEVKLDTSKARAPEKTLKKMQQVRSAALAPADPSSQDYSVARKAAQKATKARMKLAKKRREGKGTGEESGAVDQQQPENRNPQPEEETGSEPITGERPATPAGEQQASENGFIESVPGQGEESNRIITGERNQSRETSETGNTGIYNQPGAEDNSASPFNQIGPSSQNQFGGRLNLLA